MSINLVTYANQTVTPTNDAIIYERAIDQNGIFYGCDVTVTSNTVNITGGYGLVCGREFVINSDSLTVTLAPSGTLQGRLYVRLDLADADAPIQLLTVTGNTLPALVQDDDVNYTNGVYEMELAKFTVGVSSLSDVVMTYHLIAGTENRSLLWTNPSPNSNFAAGNVYLPNVYNNYQFLEIVYKTDASRDTETGSVITETKPCKNGTTVSELVWSNNAWVLLHRTRYWTTGNNMHFDDSYWDLLHSTSSGGQDNANLIPYKIYGIDAI